MAMCEALKEKYHLPKLQFVFETRAGFMLQIKKDDLRGASNNTADHPDGLPKSLHQYRRVFILLLFMEVLAYTFIQVVPCYSSKKGQNLAFHLLGFGQSCSLPDSKDPD
jgi:hypothetical protein